MERPATTETPKEGCAESRHALTPGVLFWVLFSVLAVFVRGVRWDETFEHAQILAGHVVYPEGHPLRVYVHNAFSLQTNLSAAVLALGGGPGLVCGFRNVLFLLATTLPVFLIAASYTGKSRWGHAAALLILQGIMLEFDGSYPTFAWPELYSNGHIGGGWALITLWALMTSRVRLAALLFGLMPCVHIGQWPVLIGVFTLAALWTAWRREYTLLARGVLYCGIGLAVCAVYYLAHRTSMEPIPLAGPFASTEGAAAIWKGYTALFDPHRRYPPGNGHVVLAALLVLSGMATWRATRTEDKRIFPLAWLYGLGVAGLVWGIMAIHAVLGPDIPFLLISWMPYRLLNHVPPLLLALMAGLLARERPGLLLAALAFNAAAPLLSPIVGPSLYARYIASGDGVAFAIFGAALWSSCSQDSRLRAAVAAAVPAALLAPYHHFGAACLLAGAAAAAALEVMPRLQAPRGALSAVLAVTAAVLLFHQFQYRQWLPVPEFAAKLAARLDAEPGAMLLGPPDTLLLQAQTGHPVLAETATPSLISYVPAIGPAINRIYEDVYGMSFRWPPVNAPRWEEVWQRRTKEEWQGLARRYGFRYVISLPGVPLPLRPIMSSDTAACYVVP